MEGDCYGVGGVVRVFEVDGGFCFVVGCIGVITSIAKYLISTCYYSSTSPSGFFISNNKKRKRYRYYIVYKG